MTEPSAQAPVVFQATPATPRNPYYRVFRGPLEARGWEHHFEPDLAALGERLRHLRDREVVVHLHQLEPFYRPGDVGSLQQRARALVRHVAGASLHGARVFLTMHNARPHDRLHAGADRALTRAVGGLASRVLVLGERARHNGEVLAAPARVRVLPHPTLESAYGPKPSRAAARERLALPADAFVYLSLGELKPYKQHEQVFAAMAALREPDARLVVAGAPTDFAYAGRLQAHAAALGRQRARLVDHLVPEALIPHWLAAADCAVFAFSSLLMSGSVMLALSYGLPVIAPDVGCLAEYVQHGATGLLYEPGDVEALTLAMARMRAAAPAMAAAVPPSVEHLRIEAVAARLDGLYREALADRWASRA